MARVAVDFGTSNTVIARLDPATGRTETLEIPGITSELRYQLPGGGPIEVVHAAPTCIHFAARETLIGAQVASRGLEDSPDTVRWMKRGIAYGVQKRRRTSQGWKSPDAAGREFLDLLLRYSADRISFEDDEITFTVPVEAFDTFRDWIEQVAESLGVRRPRILDEPTAAVLACREAVRTDERFLIVDFGCGTLDVSVVRVELGAEEDRKAVQLGQAGRDLGGMDIDRWIGEDFIRRRERRGVPVPSALRPAILRRAEAVKIALSRLEGAGAGGEAELSVEGPEGTLTVRYVSACRGCRGGFPEREPTEVGCLSCTLRNGELSRQLRETVDRALENAAIKAGVRRDELAAVIVTGGTSLIPRVRRDLAEWFGDRLRPQNPFDAVVRGACRGVVAPILQHDYAIESYSRERRDYVFQPLFAAGTEYPTPPDAARLWAKGLYDGMTRIGIRIFEVSRIPRRTLDLSLVDEAGALVDTTRVRTEFHHVCLNRQNPTFIVADPPVVLARDARRFPCSFRVDGARRLLVTVRDQLSGKVLLEDHPVVRL